MSTLNRDHLRRTYGERGASLVIALVFISVFSLLLAGLAKFTDSNVAASGGYRSQRTVNYATDAALDAAVNRAAHDPAIGVDPALNPPNDVCNPAKNETVLSQPANGKAPKIVVSCVVVSGSRSGEPADLGSAPPDAVLTLGDRRTDNAAGTPISSVGVRNTEPPPWNNNEHGPCDGTLGSGYQESGIRLNRTVWPGGTFFGIFDSCAVAPGAELWRVRGNIFSNSKIVIDKASAADVDPVPTIVAPSVGAPGTIKARGGCVGSGFGVVGSPTYCENAGWDFSDGNGKDPGLATAADYAPQSISGLVVRSVPPASDCTDDPRHLVTFEPGIYRSAKALNDLFGDSRCMDATFWFKPADPHNTPSDPSDDVQGVYYFDFTNADSSPQCAATNPIDFVSRIDQNTKHQWCVGGAGDGYAQRVIGGSPFNWAPTADPTDHLLTLESSKVGAGPGQYFGFFPQPTQFTTPGDNCPGATSAATLTDCGKAIDGKTVNYAMSSSRSGSSIWLSDYSDVPRGSYNNGIDLEIAQGAVSPDRMNSPTVQVNYQTTGFLGLKSTGKCGPYTLDKPPAGGVVQAKKLSEMTNGAAMVASLSGCLNTGDRINSAVVQYNVNRPGFQRAPYATAKLDGARILVKSLDQPRFPQPPTAADPGGDCDPESEGVQFIFGGDSRVYVANGGFELCAGPNPAAVATGQQIALYGVPAPPRLVPNAATGSTNPNYAKLIAEGDGPYSATMAAGGNVTLSYPGYSAPSGYSVSGVQMRSSYEAPSAVPTVKIQNGSGSDYCTASGLSTTGTSGLQSKTIDVSSCLTTARFGSDFRVSWTAGSCSGGNCPNKLDGVEFVVTLTPVNENTTLRPQSGCITASPDLWYGAGADQSPGASSDCSMVRVDGRYSTPLGAYFGLPRQGRLSVKGTIYAPSASVDIDDEDAYYPIAERGIIVRHLRLRGFKAHVGAGGTEPIFNNWLNKEIGARQVTFLACKKDSGPCTPTDPTLVGRAAVSFAAQTNEPSIDAWSLGKI